MNANEGTIAGRGGAPAAQEEAGVLRHRFHIKLLDTALAAWKSLLWCVVVLGVGYFLMQSVRDLAGKETAFNAFVNAIVDMRANEYIAYLLGGGGVLAWWRERQLRKRTIRELGAHTRKLEVRLDPERVSSGLRDDGTPPEESDDVD